MNARGKPLTVFENFKARLEHHLASSFPQWTVSSNGNHIPIKDYFSHNIETKWANLFWIYRDPASNLYDDQVMNLYRGLAIVTRNPDDPEFDSVWQGLRNDQEPLTFQRCANLGCTDERLLKTFFSFLDKLSGSSSSITTYLADSSYFSEIEIFTKTISRKGSLTYDELVLLHAYSGYLERNETVDPTGIWEWMRVVSNLARNTIYNRPDDFQRSVRSLNGLFEHADSILSYLGVSGDSMTGFNEQQVREEKLKAQLILSNAAWKTLISKAELHGYFAGQIEFLFKFSGLLGAWLPEESITWNDAQDTVFREIFSTYLDKANSVFGSQGLRKFEDYLWERALMTEGDYLIESGRNFSFLRSEGRETSWKRLLRGNPKKDSEEQNRGLVKQVFDKMENGADVDASLQKIIEGADLSSADDWRRILITNPKLIDYCENRLIRFQSPQRVYLLRRSQMNGLHSDLFSCDLYLRRVLPLLESGELPFVTASHYFPVTDTDSEPFIQILLGPEPSPFEIRVSNTADDESTYAITIEPPNIAMSRQSSERLMGDHEFSWQGISEMSPLVKTVSRDAVVSELLGIISLLGAPTANNESSKS